MFLMIGMNPRRTDYKYCGGAMICSRCGRYGSYRVCMTCMCLSLFLIPVFKWDRKYFAQSTCCGTVYELEPEIGRRIARGEDVEILPQHLRKADTGSAGGRIRRCSACGYVTGEDFEFCPKCGQRF